MEHLLEKRVRYFLTSKYRSREEVRRTLDELRNFGKLVLIGGMLRDLALFGNVGFCSDVDLVIDPLDLELFDQRMNSIGAKVNRFGGYSLPGNRWHIDVWPLTRTWAHTAGHIKVRTFDDLQDTTFFRCDAITYDLTNRKLNAKQGYFDDLRRKVLEINLLPNPNPTGNAVRAFRYCILKGFHWGPKLTRFVAEIIDEVGWESLAVSERHSFHTRYLAYLDRNEVESRLSRYLSQHQSELFEPIESSGTLQLTLPLLD